MEKRLISTGCIFHVIIIFTLSVDRHARWIYIYKDKILRTQSHAFQINYEINIYLRKCVLYKCRIYVYQICFLCVFTNSKSYFNLKFCQVVSLKKKNVFFGAYYTKKKFGKNQNKDQFLIRLL